MNVIDKAKELVNKKYSIPILHVCLISFYMLFFWVITQSSFSADDLLNANAAGCNYIPGDSVWKLTVRQWFVWFNRGRFFPCSNYVYLLFAAMPNRFCYKLFLLCLVYLNSLLMAKCVGKMLHSKAAGLIIMIIFPLSLQLTPAYDGPLYCYHGLMQLVLLGSEISLLSVFKYIDLCKEHGTQKKYLWILIGGAFAYMISLGMYEIAFILASFLGLGTWSYTRSVKKSLKVLIPNIIAFVIMLILNIYFKTFFTGEEYGGTAISLALIPIITTFLKQLFSTLPFAGLIVSIHDGGSIDKHAWLAQIGKRDILMVVIFLLLLVSLTYLLKKKQYHLRELLFVFFTGLCLMVFPSMLIAITLKYQIELYWGQGYLPNYIQNFGLALMILSIYLLIIRKLQKKGTVITTIVIALIAVPMLLGQQSEAKIVAQAKYHDLGYNRDTALDAISLGVLEQVQNDDVLFGTSPCVFDNAETSQFYTFAAKRQIHGRESGALLSAIIEQYGSATTYNDLQNIFVAFTYADANGGFTMVAECSSVTLNEEHTEIKEIYVTNPSVYINGEPDFSLTGWNLVKTGKNGCLYEYNGTHLRWSTLNKLNIQ